MTGTRTERVADPRSEQRRSPPSETWGTRSLGAVLVNTSFLALTAVIPLTSSVDPPGEFFTLTKIVAAISFASFFLVALISRRRLSFDGSHLVVLLIVIVAILSTLQARDVSTAMFTTSRYVNFALLYFVAGQLLSGHALQRRFVWVLSAATALAAALAIGNLLSGRSFVATTLYGDPNDIAFNLVTTLPLTFLLLRERPRYRPIVVLFIGAISGAVLLSLSRGAFVAVGAATLWQLAVERKHVRLVLSGIAAAVLVAALALLVSPARVQAALEGKADVAAANVANRLGAWSVAARLSLEHPLLGVGPGNFQFYYAERRGPGAYELQVVHNTYLEIAAELGPVALLLFFAYLGLTLTRLAQARRAESGLPELRSAARLSLVVAIVAGVFLSEQFYAPFWLLGGLGNGIWRASRTPPPPA